MQIQIITDTGHDQWTALAADLGEQVPSLSPSPVYLQAKPVPFFKDSMHISFPQE